MRNAFTKALLVAAGGAFFGCTGSADLAVSTPPGVATGSLTVTWTIEGSASPAECDSVGADNVELALFDASGTQTANVYAACQDFSVSVELPEGSYDAEVTLVDASNRSVSTTLSLRNLDVIEGTDITSDIDFPSASIL